MKNFIIRAILAAFLYISISSLAYAQNMSSGSGFEIIDPTINSGGNDDQSSTSSSFQLMESIGAPLNDTRFESTNYQIGVGIGYTFMAHVPIVDYFQTDDATMENICGDGGCYDRARFELDTQNNPSDTLYLLEISDDSWVTIKYVDGVTHQIGKNKDINDYLTQAQWETGSWAGANILGLIPQTAYDIRARALNGDFTETGYGPDISETTTVPYIYLSVNIAGGTWGQSDPPHTIDLGDIGPYVTTASDYIWIDLGTNAVSGATVSVSDLYDGLYNSGGTIDSNDEDLATADDGFGLRIDTSKWLPLSGTPGYYRGKPKYYNAGSSDYVGEVSTSAIVIMCSIDDTAEDCDSGSGYPVNGGRGAIWVKARAAAGQASGSYTDTLTFTSIGTF